MKTEPKVSLLLDEDGDPIMWKGDLHPNLLAECASPKCKNKATEHGTFCDKHGGVIAGC